jgi:hypothetical protein
MSFSPSVTLLTHCGYFVAPEQTPLPVEKAWAAEHSASHTYVRRLEVGNPLLERVDSKSCANHRLRQFWLASQASATVAHFRWCSI